MTARALRVGVLLGGNLVEERTFADASPITVGQSLRCRLSIPADGVPLEHALFIRDQGQLRLCLTAAMTGRIAQGGAVKTDLHGHVPIERGARGKIQIGEATVLFQEIAAPVRTPRPQLPASVRGTFADRIDRRLAVIVGGSLVVHLAIGAWAWATDVEDKPLVPASRLAEYRQDTYRIDMPDEVTPTTQEPGAASPVAPVQTPAPIVKPTRISQTPSGTPRMTESEASRFAQILTSTGETPRGPGEMSARLPGSDLGQQLEDIKTNNRTIGNTDGGFRNREREGIGNGPKEIAGVARHGLELGTHVDEAKPPRITLKPPATRPPGEPSSDGILAKIRNDYMPGLIRCYKRALVGDATLSGKVAVTFTVTETGKIADPTAKGMTSEVDACIASQMATWRFPIVKDKDGDARELDIAMSLALVPGM